MKYFVCATIRILGAWLSEESQALRDEGYDILPFILQLGSDTFEAQKLAKLGALPGSGSNDLSNFTPESALTILQKHGKESNTPDTLRFLIPGMCHLVAEDKPRKIILDMKMHETLFTYLSYHWSIFDCFKVWLQKHEGGVNVEEPKFMLESSNFEMMNSLPTLQNTGEQLVLYGNLSVLGLLVLKHHSRRPKSTDYSVYKFVQAVVRFLWDAHNTDESDADQYP